jgi:hypothetical protein
LAFFLSSCASLIMASFSFPPLVPPTVTSPVQVQPVVAAIPAAAIAAEAEALPFSLAQAAPATPLAGPDPAQDPASLRPDQVIMSRQLTYPTPGGPALAAAWRSMVRSYAAQLTTREQQARAGHLTASVLIASQDGRVQRGIDASGTIHPDAWRFTVHARGAQEQYLSMVTADPDAQSGRRRHARAALRLDLTLSDGAKVTIQADPLPGGVALEISSNDPQALERLREMQPVLELAVGRAGVRVLRWRYRDALPPTQLHARAPSPEAASALSLPVFRAIAELALLLPAHQALAG